MLALNFSLQTHWKAACSRQFCGFDDLQGLSTLLPSFPMCWAYVESSIGAAFLSCPLAGFQHGVLLPAGPALHERPWPLREVGVASRVAQARVCTQNNCVGSCRAQGAASLGSVSGSIGQAASGQAAQRLTALPVGTPGLFLGFEDMGPAPQLQGH